MNYDTKKSGAIIRRVRKERGFTQEAFAAKLNIDHSGVAKIETGARGCSVDLLLAISDVLDVSVDYLLRGHEFLEKEKKPELKKEITEAIRLLENLKKVL